MAQQPAVLGLPGVPAEAAEAAEDEAQFAAPTRHDRIGRIVAPVMINGKGPFRLVVDTGASHSSITHEVATALGLVVPEGSVALLNGVTGSALVPALTVERIQAGDLVIEDSVVPVIGSSMLAGTDGVLGMAGLRSTRLSVDFRRDRVTISRSRGGRVGPYLRIDAKHVPGGLLAVRAKVRHVRAQAVIDTGAARTLANMALCEELRRTERRPRGGEEIEIIGATPDSAFGHLRGVSRIYLGDDVTVNDVEIICGDFHIFNVWGLQTDPGMVIGMDVLGGVETLIVDFARPEVLIRPREAMRFGFPVTGGR